MTEQKARPDTLTPRRPVQPAPDEGVDPVDLPAPVKKAPRQRKAVASAKAEGVMEYKPKERDIVVSLSTRVSLDISRMLEAEVAKSGKSVRAAVEHALVNTYGQDSEKS
jgi:hypothetical protein